MRLKKDKDGLISKNELELFEKAPVGILVFDGNWKVTKVNSNFLKLGIIKSPFRYELEGKSVLNVNVFESPDIFPLVNSLRSNQPFEKEIKSLNTLDGSEITVILKGVPLFENDKFLGGILIAEDLKISADAKRDRLFSSDLVANLFSNIADFYFVVDGNGNVLHADNSSGKKNFGFLLKTESKNLSGILFSKGQFDISEIIRKVAETNKAFESLVEFFVFENKITVKAKFIPFKQQSEQVDFILVLLSETEGDEVQTGKSEAKDIFNHEDFFRLLDDVDEPVVILDYDGNIKFVNGSAIKTCGKRKEELLGEFCNKLFPLFDKSKFAELKKEILEKKHWEGTIPFFKTDKEHNVFVRFIYEELKDEKYFLVICKEKEAEKSALDDAAKRVTDNFRKIINITKEFIITFRPDGKIIFVNPHFTQEFKYHVDEAVKLNFLNLIDKNYEHINGFSLSKIAGRNVTTQDLPLKTKDGRVLICQATINAIKDSKGEVKYFNAILKDITGEHRAKNELRKLYKALSDIDNGIVEFSNNKVVYANEKFSAILGYPSSKDLIGKEISDLLVPENEEKISELLSFRQNGKPKFIELSWLTKNGSPVKLLSAFYPLANSEKVFVIVKHRGVEPARIEPGKPFGLESIIENLDGFVWSAEEVNGKLKAVYYSDSVFEITGYESEDFLADEKLWIKIIHPEDTEKVISELREFYHKKLNTNKLELEYRIIRKDGQTVWVNNKITVRRKTDGSVERVYGLVTDVSKKKKSEEDLQKYARDLKKLNETKDRFISIISHDLRTPFSSILGFTDMLLTEKDLDDEKKNQYIGFIKDSALNMLSLVNSLLDWIKLQTGKMKFEPARINAKEVLSKVIHMLAGRAMQKGVSIVSELEHDYFVYADEDLLMIIFNNLISNSLKFTPSGGSISVKARYLIDRKMVEFTVKDTGVGMDEEEMSKLFRIDEKFTTLGTEGERGSGLGLKLVHEIIQRHGGNIKVQSKKGEGTEMIFTLPVAANTILLIDDSKTDRILYSRIITSMLPGYEIVEASGGKEALDVLEKISPSLIISDHGMPEMSGYEFVRQLSASALKFKPPVIILSSDVDEKIERMYKDLGIQYVFSKPVNLTVFKKALEESLKEAVFI